MVNGTKSNVRVTMDSFDVCFFMIVNRFLMDE